MTSTVVKSNFEDIWESNDFKKSLKDADVVLQYVNKKYISLNDFDHRVYAEHLTTVLKELVQLMKNKDALFNKLYVKEHFAGSYPDGLKIGKPEEYDMNLIIKLPVDHSKLKFETDTPSFIMIKGEEVFCGEPSLPPEFSRWVDAEGYLLQTKFREWMEGVLTKAFDGLPYHECAEGNTRCLKVEKQKGEEQEYKIRYKKSGPAITVKVTTPDNKLIDVDLVPAFQFGHPIWPESVLPLPKSCNKKSWMAIPKPKKLKEGEEPKPNDAREWRMSFLDQERELLSGTGTVKPTIKLLKKLRDASNIKLSSYAIKTVILMEMSVRESEFWKNRGTYLFLYMLHRLAEKIKTGHIPFYWDERDDLLKMNDKQFSNVSNRLGKLLKEMIRGVEKNPYIIAEKLLTKDELAEVMENCKVPNGVQAVAKGSSDSKEVSLHPMNMPNGDNVILAQILETLTKIQKSQETLPEHLFQIITGSKGHKDHRLNPFSDSDHYECLKKQADLEERIFNLEDDVRLLKAKLS
ncbi:Cyclic GMP-AMP synthase, partial [Frankliniella fusca]